MQRNSQAKVSVLKGATIHPGAHVQIGNVSASVFESNISDFAAKPSNTGMFNKDRIVVRLPEIMELSRLKDRIKQLLKDIYPNENEGLKIKERFASMDNKESVHAYLRDQALFEQVKKELQQMEIELQTECNARMMNRASPFKL